MQKGKRFTISLLLSLVFAVPYVRAGSVAEGLGEAIPFWPEGKMPRVQAMKVERLTEQGHLTDVTVPALYFFPAKGEGAKPCVIVCPDGGHGYGIRYQLEYSVAGWQNLAAKWFDRTLKKLRSKK